PFHVPGSDGFFLLHAARSQWTSSGLLLRSCFVWRSISTTRRHAVRLSGGYCTYPKPTGDTIKSPTHNLIRHRPRLDFRTQPLRRQRHPQVYRVAIDALKVDFELGVYP
ncbi:unnamed protein product, partial [Ectocarpus sp. 12 AP-2014]